MTTDKQRPKDDVNSAYKRNAELLYSNSQWALYTYISIVTLSRQPPAEVLIMDIFMKPLSERNHGESMPKSKSTVQLNSNLQLFKISLQIQTSKFLTDEIRYN